MNNGVNNTNNLNNENNTGQPVLQPTSVTTNVVPNVPVAPQTVAAPSMEAQSQPVVEVVTTPVANEAEAALQTIPGVIVAPPQNNGMDKPNPIQPIPGTEAPSVSESVAVQQPQEVVPSVTPASLENGNANNSKKKKSKLTMFLILIIICLIGGIAYLMYSHKMEVARLNYECTPVSTAKDTKELELDSTIVTDLYAKVKTSLREDLASMELNDQMKIYLAFRQIPASKFYDSNCNLFSNTVMEPYKCVETTTKSPLAFKEEDLQIEIKKLFGESVNISNANVQLGENNCIGGYQYIAERGEFVEGECSSINTTIFKMNKELVKAESRESTITLYEEVKYYNAEGIELPEKLKSGTYVYTFKLDTNYNYVYVSKVLQEK